MLRIFHLLRFVVLLGAAVSQAGASRLNPVSWTLQAPSSAVAPGSTVLLRLQAHIENGYHLYSFTTPKGGANKTTALLQPNSALGGFRIYQPRPNRHVDPTLGVTVETYENDAGFPVLITIDGNAGSGSVTAAVQIRYQACSSEICLPPVTRTASANLTIGHGAVSSAEAPKGYALVGGLTAGSRP